MFDRHARQLTARGLASGLVAVVAHNPEFATREFSGETRFGSDTLVQPAYEHPNAICPVTAHPSLNKYLECKIFHMAHAAHRTSHTAFRPDLSEYLLGAPKRRPRFDWFLFAIAAGTLLALVVFSIANLIF